jgi:hypothetical protein
MDETPENGKESSHPAHADGMNESSGTPQLSSYNYVRCVCLCSTAAVMQAGESL